ncbi:unnamed protein product [Prorocentrum cordatum]|uniref:Uncharacterized protein n=1 Tax=Prorocentrum cordatum TaxID=2364126 RepID=A0ABN9XCY9_9DINO|nr:unnamed protein product [Polarella glacialis]
MPVARALARALRGAARAGPPAPSARRLAASGSTPWPAPPGAGGGSPAPGPPPSAEQVAEMMMDSLQPAKVSLWPRLSTRWMRRTLYGKGGIEEVITTVARFHGAGSQREEIGALLAARGFEAEARAQFEPLTAEEVEEDDLDLDPAEPEEGSFDASRTKAAMSR